MGNEVSACVDLNLRCYICIRIGNSRWGVEVALIEAKSGWRCHGEPSIFHKSMYLGTIVYTKLARSLHCQFYVLWIG